MSKLKEAAKQVAQVPETTIELKSITPVKPSDSEKAKGRIPGIA